MADALLGCILSPKRCHQNLAVSHRVYGQFTLFIDSMGYPYMLPYRKWAPERVFSNTKDFKQLSKLPGELKIQVIRKFYPVVYARFRRANRNADEFCEKNRTRLGVYCGPQSFLILGDYHLKISVNNKEKLIMGICNIDKAKLGLSGFLIENANLNNSYPHSTQVVEGFEPYLINCLEATPDLAVRRLHMVGMTVKQIKWVLNTWRLRSVLITPINSTDLLELPELKKFHKVCYCMNKKPLEEKIIQKLLTTGNNRMRIGSSEAVSFNTTICNILNYILQNWINGTYVLRSLALPFQNRDRDLFDHDLRYGYLNPAGMFYLGQYVRAVEEEMVFDEKWDIWINRKHEKSLIISIKREHSGPFTRVWITVDVAESHEALVTKMSAILQEIYKDKPVDFSVFHGMNSLEEIKEQIQQISSQLPKPFQEAFTNKD